MPKSSEEKTRKIIASRQLTKQKRLTQSCKTYYLKIDFGNLNKSQKSHLHNLFLEAKWFYNFLLSQENILTRKVELSKLKSVEVKTLDALEQRPLNYLSSQMKQGIHDRISWSIKSLSKLKKNGRKIGKLKFKKELNSIPLVQYGITYKFVSHNKLKIQCIRKPLRVLGVNQLPPNAELASANLIKKPSGYYVAISTFIPKEESKSFLPKKPVGLDLGIKTTLTTSDGDKFDIRIGESDRLKRLQKRFAKKKKGSRQRYKVLKKIRREYERITNQKNDKVNKIVAFLLKKYDKIYIQNENIVGWHKGLFGKQVQHSALGAIKSKIISLESTQVIGRYEPTTKLCYVCGVSNNQITLSDRIFECINCGYSEDRDVKAAKTVLKIGIGECKPHRMGRTITLPELITSAEISNNITNLGKL